MVQTNNVKIIFRLKACVTLACLFCALPSQAQEHSSIKWADSLHQSLYTYFYDSTSGLFTETDHPATDERPFSYLWPLCALIQAGNELEAIHPGKDYMKPVMKSIGQYRSTRPPVPGYDSYAVTHGGGDRFYDDNQWIGLAYMDAFRRTAKKNYLELATEIYRFQMSGYDTITGGGLYWKETDKRSKNTCSNGPGLLLALRLYQATGTRSFLDTARLLYDWINQWFRSPDGLYYDNVQVPGRKIDPAFYTYNSGTMIQANAIFYELTRDNKFLKEAQFLAQASLDHFFRNGSFPNNYWFNAVLMRGYQELYRLDRDKTYLRAMFDYARKERQVNSASGNGKKKKLLDVAGLLEIVARMAELEKEGF